MNSINSKVLFRESNHRQPFSFDNNDYSVFTQMPDKKREAVLISIATDIFIVRSDMFLKSGVQSGIVVIKNKSYPISFEPKESNGYGDDIIFLSKATGPLKTRLTDLTVEVVDGMIRIDRLFSLENEFWIPKKYFYGAEDLDDGRYRCLTTRERSYGNSNETPFWTFEY